LASLTSVPASLIGLENEVGKLLDGFWANFIVTNGELFSQDSKILENWVQGERFKISKELENKVIGDYNLAINKEIYRLRLKSKGAILLTSVNQDKDDSLGVNVNFKQTDLFINMTFSLKEGEGVYRLSGSNLTEGKILEGSGVMPTGESLEWVAVKQATEKKPKVAPKPSAEDSSIVENSIDRLKTARDKAYDLLIYPFSAYGRRGIHRLRSCVRKKMGRCSN